MGDLGPPGPGRDRCRSYVLFDKKLDRVGPGGRLDRYEAVNCYSYSQSTSIVAFS